MLAGRVILCDNNNISQAPETVIAPAIRLIRGYKNDIKRRIRKKRIYDLL